MDHNAYIYRNNEPCRSQNSGSRFLKIDLIKLVKHNSNNILKLTITTHNHTWKHYFQVASLMLTVKNIKNINYNNNIDLCLLGSH